VSQFQTLTDQQHVLYEEHIRNKSEYQAHIASVEKQLQSATIQSEQYSIMWDLFFFPFLFFFSFGRFV
jgi:hypothetical protein